MTPRTPKNLHSTSSFFRLFIFLHERRCTALYMSGILHFLVKPWGKDEEFTPHNQTVVTTWFTCVTNRWNLLRVTTMRADFVTRPFLVSGWGAGVPEVDEIEWSSIFWKTGLFQWTLFFFKQRFWRTVLSTIERNQVLTTVLDDGTRNLNYMYCITCGEVTLILERKYHWPTHFLLSLKVADHRHRACVWIASADGSLLPLTGSSSLIISLNLSI